MSNFKVIDKYFLKAKHLGYRARSVFKLEEIQNKFKIIKKGDKVLDLGSAPGSFLQFLAKIVGTEGEVVGVDLQKIEPLPYSNLKIFQEDIFSEKLEVILKNHIFDGITSDLAPKTSGVKDLDQARSVELNEQVLKLANKFLKKDGYLILKIFVGGDFQNFVRNFKILFKNTKVFKPKATRDSSFEVYLIGFGFKR